MRVRGDTLKIAAGLGNHNEARPATVGDLGWRAERA